MYIRLLISLLSDIAKTIPKATAEKNLHNLLVHVFESEFNKKVQNGKSMGSYYLPSDITFQEHTKEKFEAIKKKMLRAEMLSPKTVKNILNAFNVPPKKKISCIIIRIMNRETVKSMTPNNAPDIDYAVKAHV